MKADTSKVTGESGGLGETSANHTSVVQRYPRRAYLAYSVGAVAIAGWGFWPSYLRPLLHGGVNKYLIIHVHAAVFLGWLLLVVTQAWLAAAGRIELHRRVGRVGVTYGIFLVCVGAFISFASPILHVQERHIPADRAAMSILYNLTDMLVFSAFFATAILYRSKPKWHKRLILSATVALLGAAVGRVLPAGSLVYVMVWLSPLFAAMAVDLWIRRRLHPISLISLPIFVLDSIKVDIFSVSPLWQTLARALIRPFL